MVGRRTWSRVVLAVLVFWSVRAQADEPPGPSLFSGPSLYETGRIGGMSPEVPGAAAIAPGELAARSEKSVSAVAAELEEMPKPVQGIISAGVLQNEIAAHFASLEECRLNVARTKQMLPAKLTADTLLLRWRIERDGTITTTDVVATSPIDMAIMDCVKESMSRWTFTRPRGGTVSLERSFAFRHLRPESEREVVPTLAPAPESEPPVQP